MRSIKVWVSEQHNGELNTSEPAKSYMLHTVRPSWNNLGGRIYYSSEDQLPVCREYAERLFGELPYGSLIQFSLTAEEVEPDTA